MKLKDKRAVITGASQGLGLAIAKAFAREGANLVLCARDGANLESARQEVSTLASGTVIAMVADVAVQKDVDLLSEKTSKELGGLDYLIANAGVYGPKGRLEEIDWESWRAAIEVNLFGAVYCCRAFLPLLLKSQRGKILLLSGGGATKPLPFLSAYAASKAALVRFGETIAEELADRGVDVNMMAPGALNTRLLDEVLEAGPAAVGEGFYQAALKQKKEGGTPLDYCAELSVYLCGGDGDGITGKLISAVWDPWREFGQHREELAQSDIYTLRRILPADRGKKWG